MKKKHLFLIYLTLTMSIGNSLWLIQQWAIQLFIGHRELILYDYHPYILEIELIYSIITFIMSIISVIIIFMELYGKKVKENV